MYIISNIFYQFYNKNVFNLLKFIYDLNNLKHENNKKNSSMWKTIYYRVWVVGSEQTTWNDDFWTRWGTKVRQYKIINLQKRKRERESRIDVPVLISHCHRTESNSNYNFCERGKAFEFGASPLCLLIQVCLLYFFSLQIGGFIIILTSHLLLVQFFVLFSNLIVMFCSFCFW